MCVGLPDRVRPQNLSQRSLAGMPLWALAVLVCIPEERHHWVEKISLLSCLRGLGLLPEVSGLQTFVTAQSQAKTNLALCGYNFFKGSRNPPGP